MKHAFDYVIGRAKDHASDIATAKRMAFRPFKDAHLDVKIPVLTATNPASIAVILAIRTWESQ
jgi:hypothetical protein